jgi:lipid A disaccharide synthetase
MNIAILSGELSGDLIGGALAQELRRLAPDIALWGLGSSAMRDAGVDLLADSAGWGAVGLTLGIAKVPGFLFNILPRVKGQLRKRRPDVVVLIDFGAFNVPVARYARRIGLKVCYYFPPGSWRRTGTQGAALAKITDLLVTPFAWSAERFQSLGANAVNVGHPMLERVRAVMTRTEFAAHFDMDPSRPIIGLLPGSRHHEVTHLMPVLVDAARLIYQQIKDAQFVIGVAPTITAEKMATYLTAHKELLERWNDIWLEFAQEAETKLWKPVVRTASALTPQSGRKLVTVGGVVVSEETLQEEMQARRRSEKLRSQLPLPPTVLAKGLTYDVMAHSDVLLTCSGTATLEAALFGTPMVILYRGPRIMEIEYKLRRIEKRIPHIGLPNILADRRIVPELIQWAAIPETIAAHALELLNNLETRHRMKQDLLAVRAQLGEPGASERTARLVLELAKR